MTETKKSTTTQGSQKTSNENSTTTTQKNKDTAQKQPTENTDKPVNNESSSGFVLD